MINRLLALLLCSTLLTACPPRRSYVTMAPMTTEQEFISSVEGHFTNAIQVGENPDVPLKELHAFPIWSKEGYYTVYFEEFESNKPEKTRRQWVLWVDAIDNNEIVAYTYKLKNPDVFVGISDPSAFDQYSFDQILELCTECEITFKELASFRYAGFSSGWTCNCWSGEAVYYQLAMDIQSSTITWNIEGFDGNGTRIEGNTPTVYRRQ